MSKRAQNVISQTRYNQETNPVICALVEFAAQNSGMEYANYGEPVSYRQEARAINQDWQRFKAALNLASIEGVSDVDVIKAAPNAFSGRLSWAHDSKCPLCHGKGTTTAHGSLCSCCHWEYCTGQYFPTEYRKAAATVLEYAIRQLRQARPPKTANVTSIADLKKLNENNGGCWFNPGEMRFFRTRIESGIIRGHYFITSEQREDNTPRKFTVRSFDAEGAIDTSGEFHAHNSKAEAMEAIRQIDAQPVTA